MVKKSTLSLTLTSRTDAADRKQCFSKEKTLYGRKESFLRNTPSYFMFAKDLFSLLVSLSQFRPRDVLNEIYLLKVNTTYVS